MQLAHRMPAPNSGNTSSAYTDGTHGAYNEPAMAVAQHGYSNYNDSAAYAPNNYAGGHDGGGYAANDYSGGYAGGNTGGGEAYGMNNLAGGYHDPSFGQAAVGTAVTAGAAGLGAGTGAYAAHHNRQRSPPPPPPNKDVYQNYGDSMGMGNSLEGGRYPAPPVRSRSMNQDSANNNIGVAVGQGPGPGSIVGRSLSNSSSGHGHGGYGYPSQQGRPSPPSVSRQGSKTSPPGYSQNYGAPLPQMQEHHNEADAYDGMSPETDHHHGQQYDDDFGEVEDAPRVLRVGTLYMRSEPFLTLPTGC